MLVAHEPAWLVGADWKHGDVDGREASPVFAEPMEVAGISCKVIAVLSGVEEPGAPQRLIRSVAEPPRPVLRWKAGQLPAAAVCALPPAELRHIWTVSLVKPVGESERYEPFHALGQVIHRFGVEVVVVIVREDREGVGRNRLEWDAGAGRSSWDQGALRKMGIRQDDVVAVVDDEGGMADPGDLGRLLHAAE